MLQGQRLDSGQGLECGIISLLHKKLLNAISTGFSLNFTLSCRICSGVFNVTSFRGAGSTVGNGGGKMAIWGFACQIITGWNLDEAFDNH